MLRFGPAAVPSKPSHPINAAVSSMLGQRRCTAEAVIARNWWLRGAQRPRPDTHAALAVVIDLQKREIADNS